MRRGLRGLLLERDDFGGATSANSLRILHGGLRYLQTLDLSRFRESVKERRWWLQVFLELVRPLPCLMPLHGDGPRRRAVMGPALRVNDLLSLDRNRGVPEEGRLPASALVSRRAALGLFPEARPEGLQGAALWHDAAMVSPQRILLGLLGWAARGGAVALNRMEAIGLELRDGRVNGVRARDGLTGSEFLFRAPVAINAAGPWSGDWARSVGALGEGLFHPALAFNLLLDHPLAARVAVAVRAPGPQASIHFLLPRGPFTFAGTGHAPWSPESSPPSTVPEPLLVRFLAELRLAVPGFQVEPRHVVAQFCGLQPARGEGKAEVGRRPVIRTAGGPSGLVSVSGVKYTTAPAVARRTLDTALGRGSRGNRSAFLAHPPHFAPWISPGGFDALHRRSAVEATALLRRIVHEEAVHTLDDLLLRRLDWGLDVRDRALEADRLLRIVGVEHLPNRGIAQEGAPPSDQRGFVSPSPGRSPT